MKSAFGVKKSKIGQQYSPQTVRYRTKPTKQQNLAANPVDLNDAKTPFIAPHLFKKISKKQNQTQSL